MMKTFKYVYICSKLRGDVKTNIERAKRYCRHAVNRGYIPICPHIYFTQFMDDDNKNDRELALEMNESLIYRCDELWVCHYNGNEDVSEGMAREIQLAGIFGLDVVIFDFPEGEEDDNNL